MSPRLGLRKLSPSSDTACTTSATIVARDSASWRWRRSGRPLTSLPPKSRPTHTAALDSSSAAVPAARLVVQKRGSGMAGERRGGPFAALGGGRGGPLGLRGGDGGAARAGARAARVGAARRARVVGRVGLGFRRVGLVFPRGGFVFPRARVGPGR